MVSTFARFAPRLQEAIVARLGWTSLRPVQELAGAKILDGKNAIVLAPTAGGKTEAAIFPTLSQLITDPVDGLRAIYIAPIKALLNNQAERLGQYTEMVGLRRFVWHGDAPDNERRQFLREPVELLMTTPESLEVMLISPRVNTGELFAGLRVVIVDEIHALAGTDRGAHLLSVIERIARHARGDVQRIGLSATVGNPDAILSWLQGTSKRPGVVVDPPKEPARRQLLVTYREDLAALARDAAHVAHGGKTLFFCQSRAATEAVASEMRRAGTDVFVHHSAVSRDERALAEERFHHDTDACIVCTSTLELGIDVGDLDRVLQHEAPDTVSSFLQRMGRTGRRAGQTANTTFFCETSDGVLQAIAMVELAKAGWVERVRLDERCWPVLIHQLLAMALADGGVSPEDAWAHFSTVPDYRRITRDEFDRLVASMEQDRAFVRASGRLVLGPKAERLFGRRNFMELYAVFSSPQTYTVQTQNGQPIGSLQQTFVDQLVDGVSCFLLGGRPWAVLQVQHDDRRIVVERAPRGKQPTWGGYLPQFLGREVCAKVLDVITSGATYPYLTAEASAVFTERVAALEGVVAPGVGGVDFTDDEVRWWTFAGGRINSTLRHAIASLGLEIQIVADNYALRLRGEGMDRARFADIRARLDDPGLWTNAKLWHEIAEMLPSYRLSKFQPLMPDWVERELMEAYFLGVEGARSWLRQVAAPAAAKGDLHRPP